MIAQLKSSPLRIASGAAFAILGPAILVFGVMLATSEMMAASMEVGIPPLPLWARLLIPGVIALQVAGVLAVAIMPMWFWLHRRGLSYGGAAKLGAVLGAALPIISTLVGSARVGTTALTLVTALVVFIPLGGLIGALFGWGAWRIAYRRDTSGETAETFD